jgi:hypothetical protein
MAISIKIPTNWNEIQPKTLNRVLFLIGNLKESKHLDILLFFTLQNIKWFQFKKLRNAYKTLKLVPLSEIKEHFKFVYQSSDLTSFTPYFKINRTKYFAPGKRMHNITIEEFAVAEDLFYMYHKTQKTDYLKALASVFYRPKIKGVKNPFLHENLSENAQLFDKLSTKELLAFSFAYKGSSLHIQQQYKNIFKKTVSKSTKKNNSVLSNKPGIGKAIINLSGEKFGNLKETKQTNIHDFLTELDNLLKPKT